MNVQAAVIDVRTDTPKQEDIFLVDTNVWIWQTYPNAPTPISSKNRDVRKATRAAQKITEYTPYLESARVIGASLAFSRLTLLEIAHIIESTEYEIFERSYEGKLNRKEYRHNFPYERSNVVDLVESAWSQIQSIANAVDLSLDDTVMEAALIRFKAQAIDGYDLLIVEAAVNEGISQFITDDSDYAVIPGIQLFTSNDNVIAAALAQGKLVSR